MCERKRNENFFWNFKNKDVGKLYSYGYGEYGALGQGGLCYTPIPKLLKSLSDKKVIQMACGEYHTLVLTGTFFF